jgi:sugar lactone lactonase YvrE
MRPRLRIGVTTIIATLGLAAALTAPAAAAENAGGMAQGFPGTIALPDGFQPEGIAIGQGPVAYFGSLADGSIYRASLVTGTGSLLSKGSGAPSVGLKIDDRSRLFVSGGTAGDGRVIDARTGAVLADYQFATGPSFVNDDIVAGNSVWFTDSVNPVLYRLPLGPNRQLPAASDVQKVPLTGAIVYGPGFNANGITRTPDGNALLVVQSNTGFLFRVDPATGVASTVNLGGASLIDGDGMLLVGSTLYVAQNVLNTVTVIQLDRAGDSGTVVRKISDPRFDVPTTAARFGSRIYLTQARFTTPATPSTPYFAVAIKPR